MNRHERPAAGRRKRSIGAHMVVDHRNIDFLSDELRDRLESAVRDWIEENKEAIGATIKPGAALQDLFQGIFELVKSGEAEIIWPDTGSIRLEFVMPWTLNQEIGRRTA